MTLEALARTIAKARHGTDAMWANYMTAARAVTEKFIEAIDEKADLASTIDSTFELGDWAEALRCDLIEHRTVDGTLLGYVKATDA